MSSRPEKKKACSAAHKSRKRPYDSRPRSGPDRSKRREQTETGEIRVVLPDEPPHLTPGAAVRLLRILLKAYEEMNDDGDAQ